MASKRDIEAGKAFVRIYLKNDLGRQLSRALKSAGTRLQSLGRGAMARGAMITGAGAAMLAPLTAAVKSFASQGDELDKMAQRTGVAAGSLAELGFAAEQSGADLNAVEGAVLKMNRRLGRITVGQGSGQQVKAMEELGLSVEQLNKMNPEERFLALADAMARYGDDAAAAGLAQRAFGTGVDAILPLLTQGRQGIEALRAEARDLGIVPTQEEVANAAKVTDALNRVRRVVKAMVFDVGASLVEPTLQFLASAKRIGVAIKTWVKNNGELIRTAAKIGAVLVAVGSAVTAAGAVLVGTGIVLSSLGTIVGALLSPLGLITAAVVAATAAFFRWTDAGQSAYQSLSSTLGKLLSWAREVFGGISDAMAAGDLKLAAEVAWAGIKVAWTKGTGWLRTQWAELRFYLEKVWGEATFAILDTLNYLWSAMVKGFWTASYKVVDAWKWAEKSFAKGIGWVMAKLQGLDPNEVMANVEGDYGRQQANRDAGRAERDRGYKEAADARYAAIEDARQQWLDNAGIKRDTGVADAESELDEARKKLAGAIATAKVRREEVAKNRAEEVKRQEAGGGKPVAAGAKPTAAPTGAALTATYSAAAASISGYRPAGPEEKTAAETARIAENTKQMLVKMGQWLQQNETMQSLYERFLAGWKVT